MIHRRMLVMVLLGFASGLPLALTGATLQAWYTVSNSDLLTIGFLSWVTQPYTFKFLWAPFLDRFSLFKLGRRRGWMFLMQCGLILALIQMSFLNPITHRFFLALMAFFVALFSATQDVAIDAYRVDILPPEERASGTAIFTAGYRIGMIVSGGLALIIAKYWGWHATYLFMALLMGLGMIASFIGPSPCSEQNTPHNLKEAFKAPILEMLARPNIWLILLLIVLYKLGDAFAGAMTTTFLLRGLHFSLVDLGIIYKGAGLIATLAGVFIGAFFLSRLDIFRALFLFGVLQAISNLAFMLLAVAGKHYPLMVFSVFTENFCAGMGTTALLTFLLGLCDHRYAATQYALLSALSAVGRVFVGPFAGLTAARYGWTLYFFWSVIIAFPGLMLLYLLKSTIRASIYVDRLNPQKT